MDEAVGEGGGVVRGEHTGPVVEGHDEGLGDTRGEHERIVGGVAALDGGDRDPARALGAVERVPVHGVALEDGEGVEQLPEPGLPLDLGEAEVLMVDGAGLRQLHLSQQLGDGGAGIQAHPHGHGVDEQPDHGFDAGQFRRSPGDGGAEDDVVAAEESGQQQRPAGLQDGVEGDAGVAGEAGEPVVQLDRHVDGECDGGCGGAGGAGRGDEARFGEPVEGFAPQRASGVVVLPVEPAEVVAEGPHRGQPGGGAAGGVDLEEFAHQDRGGPAVDDDVVGGEHQPHVVGPESHEQPADQRWPREVEPVAQILVEQIRETSLGLVDRETGEIDTAPKRLDTAHDEPGGAAVLAGTETRAQGRVPVQQRLRGGSQGVLVHPPGQAQHGLHGVGVRFDGSGGTDGVVGRGDGAEVEQALLQRREGNDVFERGGAGHVCLSERVCDEHGPRVAGRGGRGCREGYCCWFAGSAASA